MPPRRMGSPCPAAGAWAWGCVPSASAGGRVRSRRGPEPVQSLQDALLDSSRHRRHLGDPRERIDNGLACGGLELHLVASQLGGLDALLATVQMPGGVPVATVGVGKSGAVNAAHLAARILALGDDELDGRVAANREGQATKVAAMQEQLDQRLAEDGLSD